MARFAIGQEVVCVDGGWYYKELKRSAFFGNQKVVDVHTNYGPKKNELVVVTGYNNTGTHIYLREYPAKIDGCSCAYNEKYFEPVVSADEINEALEYKPKTEEVPA